MIYLGIDSGKSGAIAAIDDLASVLVISDAHGLEGARLRELIYYLRCWTDKPQPITAAIEDNEMRGMWGSDHNKTFAEYTFTPKGILIGTGVPVTMVRPQRWQKDIGITDLCKAFGYSTKTAVENLLKSTFDDSLPELYGKRGKYKDGRGDALAIALWLKGRTVAYV